MNNNRSCKGCRDDYQVTEVQINRVLSSPMFNNAAHSVPDAIYEERLLHCKECPKLVGGYTCSLCGCIVRITAKLKEKYCPLPGNPMWRPYTESE
ncbi:DUF6171 family protein [Paenibacillus wynnii]|uniref:DUF6171 family protein n=1 Tax=Paenibacillus wynnii TaxID=268407 RepID=UPI000A01D6CD|nr:DUF6171 family protein [Paenibacillus wynnii]